MSWDERRLHDWMKRRLGRAGVDFGHDAARLAPMRGRVVVCTDQTLEGIHYEPGTAPRAVGRKAAGRALSDLAARAARPRALLLALSLPAEVPESRARALIEAVARRGEDFGAPLVGGDLCCSRAPTSLAVTAIGELAEGRPPPGRDRARPGDVVLLSGPTGGSRERRHLAIEPRIELGRFLGERGARGMIDVSDGLALDLWRLARSSGVAIRVDEVPVHADARRAARSSGRTPLDHALFDGEDHELVATVRAGDASEISRVARRRFPGLGVIGRCLPGSGVTLPDPAGPEGAWIRFDGKRDQGGWVHGG